MESVRYLLPKEGIGYAVVLTLCIFFILWIFALAVAATYYLRTRSEILRASRIGPLDPALREQASAPKTNATITIFPTTHAQSEIKEDASGEQTNIRPNGVVARHIRAIANAGREQSRLDVSELLKHTCEELFRWNGILRSALALFIVIGLLGTLMGLGVSLEKLSDSLSAGAGVPATQAISPGLATLLAGLKVAFAPSICGVLFTIIGVLLFSFFLHFFCSPTKTELERTTLTVWVPRLYPNTSQRLLETLRRSEEQMRTNFQAAEKVAEFAVSVRDELGSFSPTLKGANKALGSLNETAVTLSVFSQQFESGVAKLVSFQQDLLVLYQTMVADSGLFQQSVTTSLESAQSLHEGIRSDLTIQNDNLRFVLSELEKYQRAYAQVGEQQHADIKALVDAGHSLFDDIGNRNRQIIEELGIPLTSAVTVGLGDIRTQFEQDMLALINTFNKFDLPIKTAAEKMEGAAETVVRQSAELLSKLHREFEKRNQTGTDQLKTLTDLESEITALLRQLSEGSKNQADRIQRLSGAIDGLSQTLTKRGAGNSMSHDDHRAREATKSYAQSLSSRDNRPVGRLSRLLSFLGLGGRR